MSLKRAPSDMEMGRFRDTVWAYHRAHRREMPWREGITPYRVIVSEIMLQQTQVSRVMKKFGPWMARFPDWGPLASASVSDVLRQWSGLGYNRRALYLRRMAEAIMSDPTLSFLRHSTARTRKDLFAVIGADTSVRARLRKLHGIGPNTAGAVMAFAFDRPMPFIETNIRSVFIHGFFARRRGDVRDAEIMPLIIRALDDRRAKAHAREWYYALMDYGAYLKSRATGAPNPSRKSAHHVRQMAFKGSNRQLRSMILSSIMAGPLSERQVAGRLAGETPAWSATRIKESLDSLVREGFLAKDGRRYRIA